MAKRKRIKLPKKISPAGGIPVYDGPRITSPAPSGPAYPSDTTYLDVAGYVTFLVQYSDDVYLEAHLVDALANHAPLVVQQPTVDASATFWSGGRVSGLQPGDRVTIIASTPSYPGTVEDNDYVRIASISAPPGFRRNGHRA